DRGVERVAETRARDCVKDRPRITQITRIAQFVLFVARINMLEKLAQIEKTYEELTEQISSPDIMSDMKAYARTMKQHRSLGEIVEKYCEVKKMTEELQGAKDLAELADDDEMRDMAWAEVADIEERLPKAE